VLAQFLLWLAGMKRAVPEPADPEEPRRPVELHIPGPTIFKVLLTALVVWALLTILPELTLIFVAILLAMTLSPAVCWLERHGVSRGIAVALIGLAILVVVVGFVAVVVPSLASQITGLVSNFRAYRARVSRQIPTDYPFLKQVALQILDLPSSPEVAAAWKRPLAWGRAAAVGGMAAAVLFVLVLYLLADGKRTYAWLLAYVPRRHRSKMAETIPEVSDVVSGYVQGALLCSLLYGGFTFLVLTLLHVPAALPLALLAAICDVIPVVGVIVSIIPAALLALTVSPLAAGAIVVLYLLYHLLENYVLIPKIYGRRLRLSGLAVLATLVIGGGLFGVPGAILLLPIVAAYPAVERIWLADYLREEVLHDHSALEEAAKNGKSERTVEKVLRGERHRASGGARAPRSS
jgi:predicted PurR-regulated permease PerM